MSENERTLLAMVALAVDQAGGQLRFTREQIEKLKQSEKAVFVRYDMAHNEWVCELVKE